jgi:hypothetical protein
MPVSEASICILEVFIKSIPALQYIKTIPCKYENIRRNLNESSDQEIQRQRREVKDSLGISIQDL